eukprot:1651674-Prymnesium_polylepis.1
MDTGLAAWTWAWLHGHGPGCMASLAVDGQHVQPMLSREGPRPVELQQQARRRGVARHDDIERRHRVGYQQLRNGGEPKRTARVGHGATPHAAAEAVGGAAGRRTRSARARGARGAR